MTFSLRTARLLLAAAVGYMVVLGLVTIGVVGFTEEIAIHFGFDMEPNYGLPAPLAVAFMPLLGAIFGRWIIGRDKSNPLVVQGENAIAFAIVVGATTFAQSFICLFAMLSN